MRRGRDWLFPLEVITKLCWGFGGLAAIVKVAASFQRHGIGVPLPASAVDGVTGVHDGYRIAAGTLTVTVNDPDPRQRALDLFTSLPTLLVAVVVAYLLYRVILHARAGAPFVAPVVRLLRAAGFVVLFGGCAASVAEGVAGGALAASVAPGTLGPGVEIPYFWLLGGIGLLAIAEVFRTGVAMRDELEAVI